MTRARSALTMVEVLVALLLGVLLLTTAVGLLRSARHASAAFEYASADGTNDALPNRLIRDDLEMVPPGAALTLIDNRLEFATLNGLHGTGIAPRQRADIAYVFDPQTGALSRQEWRRDPEERRSVHLADLAAYRVDVSSPKGWASGWTSKDGNARAVRIHWTTHAGVSGALTVRRIPWQWSTLHADR